MADGSSSDPKKHCYYEKVILYSVSESQMKEAIIDEASPRPYIWKNMPSSVKSGSSMSNSESISWVVKLSKSQASGKPLCVPAEYVRTTLGSGVKSVIFRDNLGDDVVCPLLRYKRNKNEVLFGSGWKDYCKKSGAREGDESTHDNDEEYFKQLQ